VQDRIYQTVVPEGAGRPYIVWFIVSAVPENQLSEDPEDDDQRVQVDCYSEQQPEARQIMQAAAEACETQGHIVFGPWAGFEEDTRLFRWSFDLEIWNKR
jgi:hypothetical protein